MISNTKGSAEEIYLNYKSRIEVEKLANTLKNILEIDKSYMQKDACLEGWMFINHVAALIYYKIFNILVLKNLTNKYSPLDVLQNMNLVKKIQINNKWITSEIPKMTRVISKKININIT